MHPRNCLSCKAFGPGSEAPHVLKQGRQTSPGKPPRKQCAPPSHQTQMSQRALNESQQPRLGPFSEHKKGDGVVRLWLSPVPLPIADNEIEMRVTNRFWPRETVSSCLRVQLGNFWTAGKDTLDT